MDYAPVSSYLERERESFVVTRGSLPGGGNALPPFSRLPRFVAAGAAGAEATKPKDSQRTKEYIEEIVHLVCTIIHLVCTRLHHACKHVVIVSDGMMLLLRGTINEV